MELQEFITQSITQIVNGVKKAQDQNETDARVNPSDLRLGDGVTHKELYDFEHHMLLTRVEFDVAVTTEDSKGTKGGIGVFVGSVGLGTQGQSEARNSFVSRLKFSVPISLPKGN